MGGDVEYEVPSFSQIMQMFFCQAQKIRSCPFLPDVVVGVARGGVVSARFLADLLDAEFAMLQVEFYTGIAQRRAEPLLRGGLTCGVAGKAVLLVDDIADSGRTLQFAVQHVMGLGACAVKTATLYCKPSSVFIPDFYEKQTKRWVVFPWELQETLRKNASAQTGRRQLEVEAAKLVKAGFPKIVADQFLKDTP
jgi:hypoxanthine phosphoribosyltransferase